MRINKLTLKHYRNHNNLKLEFNNKPIFLFGKNGVGKTNILEAIYILSAGKSYKSLYDKNLISYGHDFCTISGEITNTLDNFDLEVQVSTLDKNKNTSIKKTKVNKIPRSISRFCGIFTAVSFSPEDMEIVTGSPSTRRRFLDFLLSQSFDDYKHNLSQFTKTVRQRNKILELIRETGNGRDQLGYWNEKALEHGTAIQEKRDEFFNFAKTQLPIYAKELNSKGAQVEIIYKKNEISYARLAQYYDREVASKNTLVGPHRDDFEIIFDGAELSEFGSRGQQRTLLLALKTSEIEFIEQIKGERPILLLDDIFSELDQDHREKIVSLFDKQQTFITSAEDLGFMFDKIDVVTIQI